MIDLGIVVAFPNPLMVKMQLPETTFQQVRSVGLATVDTTRGMRARLALRGGLAWGSGLGIAFTARHVVTVVVDVVGFATYGT